MGHNMIHHSIDPNSLFLGAIGLSFVYNPFLCTPGIFCDEPISMTHNSSSLISYLIWRSKDTRFTFYFLSGCYLHDETLMMERFTDRWIQHYFSYHKCPPVRTFRLQTLWAVDTSLQECHGLFCGLLFFTISHHLLEGRTHLWVSNR